jgi:NADH-quinone oxidoreductase subunit L
MQYLWLIPILPLAGSAINGIFGRRASKSVVNAIAIGSVLLSFLWVLKTLNALMPMESRYVEHYYTWIQSGNLDIGLDFAVDRLSAVMLLVVTGIGLVIHVYAAGYMAHEGGYYRFFSFMNLFMFFMLVLVLAANYVLMFVGWEGVGLCSYLLIGFYFLKQSASDAGKKAFIVNRIGDFGFSLAMFLIFVNFGSFDFAKVFEQAGKMQSETQAGMLTGICLLLLVGAAGKSAQIPLYVWLPDAMEGPTPVSALIHAATMVTAGVYMIARSSSLFTHAPIAMYVVAIIGLATAFMAASIGLVQNDIKRVFAYSTVSQLGYMFLALGCGAFSASIFHVVTHAFFKALLFLGAGSVIHALSGEQDLRNMGGLRTKIPVTFWTLACASVALAGVPPFSGFHSKDEILVAAYSYAPWMYWVGVITAGMTAFYVSRAMFLCFFGTYRGHHHPHESPASMTVPLTVLALLSLGGGYLPVPKFLEPVFETAHVAEAHHEAWLIYVSVAVVAIGIGFAWLLYLGKPAMSDAMARAFRPIHVFLCNKYYVDELYDATIVSPIADTSRVVLWKGMDAGLIDGTVNGIGKQSRNIGGFLRLMQSGGIRSYATWVLIGCVGLLIAMGFAWGGK